jgi:hypothetical protein
MQDANFFSNMAVWNIKYPSTDFESVILSYTPVVKSMRDVSCRGLKPLPPHQNDFHPRYLQGQGVGLCASRDFAVGETIIIERPAIILARCLHPSDKARLSTLVDRLPSDQALSTKLLANCKQGDDWVSGIIETNAFGFALPVPHISKEKLVPWRKHRNASPEDIGWLHNMIFLSAARVNHSYVSPLYFLAFYQLFGLRSPSL